MKLVLFYEKPGCVTNSRQKKLLQESGCILIVKNLLEHGMTQDELLTYLESKPVAGWFNPNAPKVKNGEVDPSAFNEEDALALLFREPILIRRPLVSVEGCRMCGFDTKKIEKKLQTSLDKTPGEKCSAGSGVSCEPGDSSRSY